jgi:hypothetical protein
MQYCHRRLAPHEFDHELLWLLVSLGAFVSLTFWLAARLPTPQCAFHSLTGLPCPTCGATRAALQFLHGHFAASLFFNPLAFFGYCAIALFDLYAAGVLFLRSPRLRVSNFTRAEKLVIRGSIVALFVGNWLYLLVARPV